MLPGGDIKMDNSLLWTRILEKIQKEVIPVLYNTWFAETKLYSLNNGVAKIIVPYSIHKEHLQNDI